MYLKRRQETHNSQSSLPCMNPEAPLQNPGNKQKKNLNSLRRVARGSGPEFLQASWSQRIMARCDHLAYIHFIETETKPWEVQWPAQDHDQLVTKSQVEFRESGPFCAICPFPFAMSNPILQGLVKGSKPEGWEQEGLSSCSGLLGELWVGQYCSHLSLFWAFFAAKPWERKICRGIWERQQQCNNNSCILNASSALGTVLSTLQALYHLILTITLWGKYNYHFHFADEKPRFREVM